MKNETRFKLFGIVVSIILIALASIVPCVLADSPSLPTRGNPGMVYDSESDKVVIFGGWNMSTTPANQETWIYDYNKDKYTQITPSPAPRRRAEPGIAYDSFRDMVILFGGRENATSAGDRDDTWSYDYNNNTWTELFPVVSPSARRGHRMVYDSESDRFIIFGGKYGSSTFYNETWIGNPNSNTFYKANPELAPPARAFHHMVYDSESDQVILFGGSKDSNSYYDTWAYDFNINTWENLTDVNNHPQARSCHIMAYDRESDRVVLFGGGNLTATFSDTWLYDYGTRTWVQKNPTTSPSARCRHEAAYDSESDRVIIYGGTTGPWDTGSDLISVGKTWGYDVNTNRWKMLDRHIIPGYSTLIIIGTLSVIVLIISRKLGKRENSTKTR